MTTSRTFPHAPRSVRDARKFALEALAGQPQETLEVVELLVSELAGNCVRHTDTSFVVEVSDARRSIRVAVTDGGPGEPVVRHVDATAVAGRGLALVESLSRSWGVDRRRSPGSGKTVWFELPSATRTAGGRRAATATANRG